MKFSHKMPLHVFYIMVQKGQKWPKTQIKGVPVQKWPNLRQAYCSHVHYEQVCKVSCEYSWRLQTSMSRAQLNFWKWPILCTTWYQKPIPTSNFGGTFYQLYLWIFLRCFHSRCSVLFLYHSAKSQKRRKPQTQMKGVLVFERRVEIEPEVVY